MLRTLKVPSLRVVEAVLDEISQHHLLPENLVAGLFALLTIGETSGGGALHIAKLDNLRGFGKTLLCGGH